MPKNLWPDFDVGAQPRTPRAAIEEAGVGLADKTKDSVKFMPYGAPQIKDNVIVFTYSLYAKLLGYHFPFLRVTFGLLQSYPVKLVADRMAELVAGDETELNAHLATIFNAPTTKETVERLIALSRK
jgi:hypothetical protein